MQGVELLNVMERNKAGNPYKEKKLHIPYEPFEEQRWTTIWDRLTALSGQLSA